VVVSAGAQVQVDAAAPRPDLVDHAFAVLHPSERAQPFIPSFIFHASFMPGSSSWGDVSSLLGLFPEASAARADATLEVVLMAGHEERLRRLAIYDPAFLQAVLAIHPGDVRASGLDPKTHTLVQLSALLAADAPSTSWHCTATLALAVGATPDEVVGTLVAVAPIIGLGRAAAAASDIALAVGYDLDAALAGRNGTS
jgi:alkylhydroperoxidase/carboxymuconolactone decarboxylase family protein YurZ